jgi:hypothetical protein
VLLHRNQSKPETLTTLVRLARASSAAAVMVVAVISFSSSTLAPVGVGGIVEGDENHVHSLTCVLVVSAFGWGG